MTNLSDAGIGLEREHVDDLDLTFSPIVASLIRELRAEYARKLDAWVEQLIANGPCHACSHPAHRGTTCPTPVPRGVRPVGVYRCGCREDARENRCGTTTLTLPGPIENRCGTTGYVTTADAKTVAAQRLSTDGTAFLKSWGGDPSGVSCAPPRLAERSCRGVPETRWGATVSGPAVRVGSLVPQRFPGSIDA